MDLHQPCVDSFLKDDMPLITDPVRQYSTMDVCQTYRVPAVSQHEKE